VQYGVKYQLEQQSPQISLFGGTNGSGQQEIQEPPIPMGTMQDGQIMEAWSRLEELNYEKEVIGFYLSGHPLDRFKWQIEAFTNATLADLEDRKDQELLLAGIVTSARERVSRKGNKFMTFTLEDFTDSIELSLFGDQYANFRHFIRTDELILLRARYQPRWNDETQYELRVFEIQLMTDEVFEQMIKHVCIELSNEELDEDLLDQLYQICTQYEGKKPLRFRITDQRYQADVPLISGNLCINPVNELIEELNEIGIKYSLN